jgi:hypothetical protein
MWEGRGFYGFVPSSALVVTVEPAAGVAKGQEWLEASHLYRMRAGSCQIYFLWPIS